jgi:GH24 family phage-related lysozyme (muramidase)
MKLSITEHQYSIIRSHLNYKNVIEEMVFKVSILTENEEREPDMEWDFTEVKNDLDTSKLWVKTKEDVKEYLQTLKNKIKNLPSNTKKRIIKYVLYSFLGILTINQINDLVEPQVHNIENVGKIIKSVGNNEVEELRVRKSSPELYEHMRYEEGSIRKKGEPVLVAYNLGDGAYTIGYGHAIFRGENEGYEFLPNYNKIIPGRTKITKDQAETLLKDDVSNSEAIINKILDKWETEGIKIKVNQGMYNAMVSMAYNMGPGIGKSDFIKTLKSGNTHLAGEEILKTSSNMFKKFPGLEPRRMREYKMFTS